MPLVNFPLAVPETSTVSTENHAALPVIDQPMDQINTPCSSSTVTDIPSLRTTHQVELEASAIITLSIHRSQVQKEMVAFFMDPSLVETVIQYHFIDEKGEDAQGVSREAYSAFWKEFFLSSSCGESERVPAIFPEYGLEEWQSVGRILFKGYTDCGIMSILGNQVLYRISF